MLKDNLGLTLSGASAEAITEYETAVRLLQCYSGDPVGACDRAIAASGGFVMAHVMKAYLFLLSTEPGAIPVARDILAAVQGQSMTAREAAHLAAAQALLRGGWHEASRILEDLAIAYPRDVLALQIGHQVDFFTGNARLLRDRVARALPVWSAAMPGHHAVLGMHAFGLEENGDYAAAEGQGRLAVELESRDSWAQHAVAHVMEMQGRQKDGIAWMRGNEPNWSQDSFLAVHNWWHLALYHLDLGDVDSVLKLYDGPIAGNGSTVALEVLDAAAMLWRLHLRGIDVGDRWQKVAERWEAIGPKTGYAFNDMHVVMARVGQGDIAGADAMLAAQEEAIAGTGDNALFTAEVGRPVAQAIRAFGVGDYAQTVRLLRPVLRIANRFGGSHAQRDVLDLTLIEAAFRAGEGALAAALAAERMAMKPTSPLNRLFVDRAAGLATAA